MSMQQPKKSKALATKDSKNLTMAGENTHNGRPLDSGDANSATPILANVNSTGLPGLPGEVICEIASHLHPVQVSLAMRDPFVSIAPNDPRVQGIPTLHALSKTCRTLRRIVLPLAWQAIEAVAVGPEAFQDNTDALKRRFTTKLITQLEVVTVRRLDLAKNVKYVCIYCGRPLGTNPRSTRRVTAFMTSFWSKEEVHLLCLALSRLPNMTHLQFLGVDFYQREKDLAEALQGIILSSVQSITLPNYACPLLACCPNLKKVQAHIPGYHIVPDVMMPLGSSMLREVYRSCPQIQEIEGFPINWKDLEACESS